MPDRPAKLEVWICRFCGKPKMPESENHWRQVSIHWGEGPDVITSTSLTIWKEFNDKADPEDTFAVCGDECLHRELAEWMHS